MITPSRYLMPAGSDWRSVADFCTHVCCRDKEKDSVPPLGDDGCGLVALVAVSSVSLWLLQSPVVDDVRRAAEPALAAIPDALPAPAEPDVQGEEPEFVIRRVIEQESSRQALVAQHLETEK